MGITGLHNFRAKPRLRTGKPQFTSSISPGHHYLAPGDIYTIYDINPLLNSGFNGTGVTIAVTGQVDINTGDVVAFRTASGLNTTNLPTTVHEPAIGGDPGPARHAMAAIQRKRPRRVLDRRRVGRSNRSRGQHPLRQRP